MAQKNGRVLTPHWKPVQRLKQVLRSVSELLREKFRRKAALLTHWLREALPASGWRLTWKMVVRKVSLQNVNACGGGGVFSNYAAASVPIMQPRSASASVANRVPTVRSHPVVSAATTAKAEVKVVGFRLVTRRAAAVVLALAVSGATANAELAQAVVFRRQMVQRAIVLSVVRGRENAARRGCKLTAKTYPLVPGSASRLIS